MKTESLHIDSSDLRLLLGAASPDAALLYLYIRCGNDPREARQELRLADSRYECAAAALRQLGLWPEEKRICIATGERPNYSERDVLESLDRDADFRALYGEVQRRLGKALNTEELKILLGFVRYLGLSADVVCVLISYCQDRARRKGSSRNPSLRTIEKEAYAWAEQGIDTLEEAAAFIQRENVYNSRLSQMTRLLQIRGRNLTAAEERYAKAWMDLGFDDEVITMAYERTCLNTGGLSWAYMNKILARWHEAGLHTADQVRNGDRKPLPKGASGELGEAELEAIRALMQEGKHGLQ